MYRRNVNCGTEGSVKTTKYHSDDPVEVKKRVAKQVHLKKKKRHLQATILGFAERAGGDMTQY